MQLNLAKISPQAPTAIIVGASSKIAQALIAQLLEADQTRQVIAISRHRPSDSQPRLHWIELDYDEESIAEVCAQISKAKLTNLEMLFICNGILHDDVMQPERSLADFAEENYLHVHQVNTLIPMLWLKHMKPVFKRDSNCIVTVFSARIGSIEDNGRGGWYSYRASKAALNMCLKSVSIEVARSARKVRFLAFHPGTTDTPLSKPFQKYVKDDKLFQPDFVAEQLLKIIKSLSTEKRIQFLAWDGKPIPW